MFSPSCVVVFLFSAQLVWSLPRTAFIAPLSRPTTRRINNTIFNPEYPIRELRGLLTKYQHAASFLTGNPSKSSVDVPVGVPPPSTNSRTAKMPLTDMQSGSVDILYYGTLSFGTPPQDLTVDVDTGSADLWVPSGCPQCSNNQFQAGSSSTYSEIGTGFEVTYGSGEVSAVLVKDIVSVQGLSIHNQTFGAVKSESGDFNDYPISGLIGMAFSSIAASGQPTFFERLIQERQLSANMFSVHLTRGKETGSEVCFGCLDRDKTTGPPQWISLASKTFWALNLDAVSVDSTPCQTQNVIAAVDTGTSLIYLPQDTAKSLYDLIPGSKPATQFGPGFFTFPCDGDFIIAFSFGGYDFAINKLDFDLGAVDEDSADCVGGILSLGAGFPANLAILGDEFLKSWYSTYDYENGLVGFSPSINNS